MQGKFRIKKRRPRGGDADESSNFLTDSIQ